MTDSTFNALVLRQGDDKKPLATVEQLSRNDLPEGDVLVAIDYSTVNYKDALAVTGKGRIIRNWPMVPGIDFAGTVLESDAADYKAGDKVVLTGWSVGERYWGGYSQQQQVKGDWLVPLPATLSTRDAMAIGTAGFTAMLCVMALEDAGITPDTGPVLVTGASGGVGSVAIALLAKLGFKVSALTGKADSHDYLRELGAQEIIASGPEWSEDPKPLETQRWAGAVDTLGSKALARILAETDYNGAVAACGLAAGFDLPTTVMPFILRGVRLLGVDSVMCPQVRRRQAWERLARDLPKQALARMSGQTITLTDVADFCQKLLARQVQGRVLVDVNA
jgi:acrylyl-CoA reductase (NADPH)